MRRSRRRVLKVRNNNGFTLIEVLAVLVILAIVLLIYVSAFVDITHKCVEYNEVPITRCYTWGGSTECESILEKRCIRYDD